MMNHTTLGIVIDWLKKQDQKLIVKDGFGDPHSDRGSYDELAFDPLPEAKISDMLKCAERAVGRVFTGWKGGEYKMDLDTPVYIGEYGECGDAITPIHFKYWLLTALINDDERAEKVAKTCRDKYHDVRWCPTCAAREDGIDDYRAEIKREIER